MTLFGRGDIEPPVRALFGRGGITTSRESITTSRESTHWVTVEKPWPQALPTGDGFRLSAAKIKLSQMVVEVYH